jgi:predicted PurR-regulated permease PerM
MVAAFVGGALAGIPGALVATPVAGAVKAIYREARGQTRPDDEDDGGGVVDRLKGMLPHRRNTS